MSVPLLLHPLSMVVATDNASYVSLRLRDSDEEQGFSMPNSTLAPKWKQSNSPPGGKQRSFEAFAHPDVSRTICTFLALSAGECAPEGRGVSPLIATLVELSSISHSLSPRSPTRPERRRPEATRRPGSNRYNSRRATIALFGFPHSPSIVTAPQLKCCWQRPSSYSRVPSSEPAKPSCPS